jgi:glycosyltransferase involved in cell wall biosynthesis
VQLEYIVVDGKSTDGSIDILDKYREEIDVLIIEEDTGPANAINKGFARASGDIISWLNADDIYYPGTLKRVAEVMGNSESASFCFGKCPIIDEEGGEIRHGITRFKELFFPISSHFKGVEKCPVEACFQFPLECKISIFFDTHRCRSLLNDTYLMFW